jgi:hypothetical protein
VLSSAKFFCFLRVVAVYQAFESAPFLIFLLYSAAFDAIMAEFKARLG